MAKLTVLGIGNLLMRDEGIGVHLLEAVMVAHDWPDEVEFVDGGAGGLNLLTVIERAERMIVFDAADMHLPPGEYRIITPEQVRDDTPEHRISMHDVPFMETLKLCEQFTSRPVFVQMLVVQPQTIEFGRELSEPLAAAQGRLLAAAVELIKIQCLQLGLEC